MADTMIISEKELNYIETLYLSANLQDFDTRPPHTHLDIHLDEIPQKEIDYQYGSLRCAYMYNYFLDTLPIDNTPPKLANGYEWFSTPDYQIGFMPYDKAKKSNLPNCVIQFNQNYMYQQDKFLTSLSLPLGGTASDYTIKRIDISKIFKSPVDYTVDHNYISPYRSKHSFNRHENTIYLGSRKNGNVFRMYPKTTELKETKNYKKIELLSQYFGDIENLYTFELELRRSHLRDVLDIHTLADISKVYDAYSNIVGRIRIYLDTDHNKALLKNNNRGRIQAFTITPFKDYKRIPKEKYKPSKDYALEHIQQTFKKYVESMHITLEKEIEKLRLEFAVSLASNTRQDILIEFSPSEERMEDIDALHKYELIRNGQTNELEKEAYQAFKPHVFNDPNLIF